MHCLKCGKETKDNQVFCEGCLASMEQYPVKPGTPVQLPNKEPQAAKKQTSRRSAPSQEEQLAFLKKLVVRLLLAMSVLLVLLALTVSMLLHNIFAKPDTNSIGRNYTTIDSSAP